MMRLVLMAGMLAFLSACAVAPTRSVTEVPQDVFRFPPTERAKGVNRSNADLTEDFLDLAFRLENGDRLPRLLKYDGPIRVALRSAGLATYEPELSDIVNRLRTEGGIDIALTDDVQNAQIHVWAVSRAGISRIFPGAACFILLGVPSWDAFRFSTQRSAANWSELERLTVTSIFIPADSTPQDTRDCLHEELAQSLGLPNDLYRLPDTVFNDDNFHSVLTPFDMLMLRTLYDKDLPVGSDRNRASELVPKILARINPAGRSVAREVRAPSSTQWKSAIDTALDRRSRRDARISAAVQAVALAQEMSPPDHRLGLSLLALARITATEDASDAMALFEGAYNQFAGLATKDDIRAAHAALHLALAALRADDPETAISLSRRHADAARKAENAMVLSGLLAIESESLLALGRVEEARKVRIDSLAWARYAFGDANGDIARASRQIAAFRPKPRRKAALP